MRILIYGGRHYGKLLEDDTSRFVGYDAEAALAIVSELYDIMIDADTWGEDITIVSGGATGADELGEMVGKTLGMVIEVHRAEWNKYGRSAGPRRNKEMKDSGLDAAIKCPGGRGTAHMTKLLEDEVPIYEV